MGQWNGRCRAPAAETRRWNKSCSPSGRPRSHPVLPSRRIRQARSRRSSIYCSRLSASRRPLARARFVFVRRPNGRVTASPRTRMSSSPPSPIAGSPRPPSPPASVCVLWSLSVDDDVRMEPVCEPLFARSFVRSFVSTHVAPPPRFVRLQYL